MKSVFIVFLFLISGCDSNSSKSIYDCTEFCEPDYLHNAGKLVCAPDKFHNKAVVEKINEQSYKMYSTDEHGNSEERLFYKSLGKVMPDGKLCYAAKTDPEKDGAWLCIYKDMVIHRMEGTELKCFLRK